MPWVRLLRLVSQADRVVWAGCWVGHGTTPFRARGTGVRWAVRRHRATGGPLDRAERAVMAEPPPDRIRGLPGF
jgi:hypothetical protein